MQDLDSENYNKTQLRKNCKYLKKQRDISSSWTEDVILLRWKLSPSDLQVLLYQNPKKKKIFW